MTQVLAQDPQFSTQILAALPFLQGIPLEDIATLAASSVMRRYQAGSPLVVQGEYGHSMFVLVAGELSIVATNDDGVPLEVNRISMVGHFFGEVALLGRGVRSATVNAAVDSQLIEIEKNRFDLLARRHPRVQEELERYYHARTITTYIRLHRYLGDLPEQAIVDLTTGATMRKFKRDELICRRGERADSVLVIKDGVSKAVRPGKDGKLSILAYFNTHDVVGAHEGDLRTFDLVALGQVEVLYLSKANYQRLSARFDKVFSRFGKDDMQRQEALAGVGATVFGAAQAFLSEGVEVESLLVINLDRCVRCGNCVRACHARHSFTRLDRRGPIFRRREHVASKKHEHVMIPSSCRHCRDPECMIGCPTGAIQRFPDGDVDINDNCIGCENCARKCPYGNITMRPLAPEEIKDKSVTKRAIKCNLCRGYEYSNCVHECPRGAVLRVDPMRYFDELALVIDAEQREGIEWQRKNMSPRLGSLDSKQRVRPRSVWFVYVSLLFLILSVGASAALYFATQGPHRGGTTLGLGFGIGGAACIFLCLLLGARKRMRNVAIGALEIWTQFHMVLGLAGFWLALAHAGFKVTGVFTTLLLVVFAAEVASGVIGQTIYMVVPRMLTRLEKQGLSKLMEDLFAEDMDLERSIDELMEKLGPKAKKNWVILDRLTGKMGHRFKASYDPVQAEKTMLAGLPLAEESEEDRSVLLRVAKNLQRKKDVLAQIRLHRTMKNWLVFHLASAAALAVFLIFHILTMLLLRGI